MSRESSRIFRHGIERFSRRSMYVPQDVFKFHAYRSSDTRIEDIRQLPVSVDNSGESLQEDVSPFRFYFMLGYSSSDGEDILL